MPWLTQLFPEILLAIAACVLICTGLIKRGSSGAAGIGFGIAKFSCGLAVVVVLVALGISIQQLSASGSGPLISDPYNAVQFTPTALFMRPVALAIGVIILLLSWPSSASGNASLRYEQESGEYYALILLSLLGMLLSFSANDLVLLFLAIELASIPTYILVAVSRPYGRAQEAALKYFFLGALSAVILLMGFAYLYGLTGTTSLSEIARQFAVPTDLGIIVPPVLGTWFVFAMLLIFVGLAFKLAAFPFQSYAADVYEGAATPVTALIGFVPKAVGIVVLLRIIWAISGTTYNLPVPLDHLLVAIAIITMTFGNVMGLVQMHSVKRALAYSSVAHSGYLIAGLALLTSRGDFSVDLSAAKAVLFYLAVYGLTSTAAFGALSLIPSRSPLRLAGKPIIAPATTAENYDDLAGAGRADPVVGLCLALACLGLIGIPLTAGFTGKYLLVAPAFIDAASRSSFWLGIAILVNSAIGATYYLRIISALFFRAVPQDAAQNSTLPASLQILPLAPLARPIALIVSVVLASVATLALGIFAPAVDLLNVNTDAAVRITLPQPAVTEPAVIEPAVTDAAVTEAAVNGPFLPEPVSDASR